MKQEKDEIDKSFENFLTEAPEKPTVNPKLIEHILEMSDECPKHQFLLLGSISNYHKYGYPSLKDGRRHYSCQEHNLCRTCIL